MFVERGIEIFLKLLDRYAIKATFFVPARVAEKFPAIIKEVVKKRHEVACHGLEHNKREALMNVSKQVQIIKIATEIIESITGSRPLGYRAPLFNINKNCWIALRKNDYIYDCSVVCSPLLYKKYNSYHFSTKPFFIFNKCEAHNLIEIPVSTNPLLPFPLGGTYLRIFGMRWCKLGVKINFLLRNPVVFYIHPKDIIPRSWGSHWWWYRNTDKCMKMFEEIIEYVMQCGAKFIKAYELAKLFGYNSFK